MKRAGVTRNILVRISSVQKRRTVTHAYILHALLHAFWQEGPTCPLRAEQESPRGCVALEMMQG